jgi:hypothetical protein
MGQKLRQQPKISSIEEIEIKITKEKEVSLEREACENKA